MAETVQGRGLSETVPGFPVDGQRLLAAGKPGVRLALLIAQALRGSERAPMRGDPVVPAALVVEEVHQAPGELPGRGAETRYAGRSRRRAATPPAGPRRGRHS